MAREYDLYKRLRDIDMCRVFDMCKGRSTCYFCRHGGVAATQGWTLFFFLFVKEGPRDDRRFIVSIINGHKATR